ncbi:MAG TPA: tyrosine--tRNA ligase, partial [Burkholderiales bacterium]|nr:tyrosine--tRNA ligase [Burkholderiales bacterium]
AEVEAWKAQVAAGRNPREIKVELAKEIVSRFHGEGAAREAEEKFEQRHRHGAIPEEVRDHTFEAPAQDGLPITHAITLAGLSPSNSESARLIEQGGVKLDNAPVSNRASRIAKGSTVLLQVGKRKFARVTVK